jgi:hypothetical protein
MDPFLARKIRSISSARTVSISSFHFRVYSTQDISKSEIRHSKRVKGGWRGQGGGGRKTPHVLSGPSLPAPRLVSCDKYKVAKCPLPSGFPRNVLHLPSKFFIIFTILCLYLWAIPVDQKYRKFLVSPEVF